MNYISKLCMFLCFIIFPSITFGNTLVGTRLIYSTLEIEENGKTKRGTKNVEVISYDEESKVLVIHEISFVDGEGKVFEQRIERPLEFAYASDFADYLVPGKLCGGELERIQVGAGVFDSCLERDISMEDDQKLVRWIGMVPFGIVKSVAVSRFYGQKITTVEELEAIEKM